MTISLSNNVARQSYAVAQGVTQSVFTVSFAFFDDDDLNVYVDGTLQTLTTNYTVTGGDGSTGTVTMASGSEVTGITGGSTVVITRDIDLDRTTDFPASGPFAVGTLNTELDKMTAQFADRKDDEDRSIRLQDFDEDQSMELPLKADRLGKVLGFNATTGAVEAGPTIADTQTLAAITADIGTLADIEDGTDATDAIQTVAGISANVTTVAGVSANVTTVAGISSNVTSVANDASDIGTVASSIANVNTVAGIDANITTVAGISSDVTAVAGDATDIGAVAGKATEIGRLGTTAAVADLAILGTADAVSDMNTLAAISSDITSAAGVSANITTVAGISANTTTVAGISANVTTVAGISSDVTAVAGNNTDITTVAGISSNVTSVAGSITNVNTVASNLSSINDFADKYRVGTTDPTTDNDEGDLFYNTTSNTLKIFNGSAFEAGVTAGSGFAATTGASFTGNVNFDDNVKAQFGAGPDLEIYSDGNSSFIQELSGVGSLFIDGNFVSIRRSGGTENKAVFKDDGAVELYHNGNKKLDTTSTGIDVTGTAQADSFTLDNGSNDWTFTVSSNNLIFSYAGTAKMKLDSSGNLTVTGDVISEGTI